MSAKVKSEFLPRVGRLLKMLLLLCVAVIVVYFIIMLATGKLNGLNGLTNSQNQNYLSTSAMGELLAVNGNQLDLSPAGTGKVLEYNLTEVTVIQSYNPETKLNENVGREVLKPGANLLVTFDAKNNIEKIVLMPFSLSGEVKNNQAGVLTVGYLGNDYLVRTDPKTMINRQDGTGNLETDLTVANLVVGDLVSVIANQSGKAGNYSFTAAEISILPKPATSVNK